MLASRSISSFLVLLLWVGCGSVSGSPADAPQGDASNGPDASDPDAATLIDAPVATCAEIPPYMRARYRADGNALDDGDKYNATLVGVTYGTGKYGSAFVFDGVDDQVTVDDGDELWPTGALTLEAWVKSPAPHVEFASTIVCKHACENTCTTNRDTAYFCLSIDPQGVPDATFRPDSSGTLIRASGTTAITDDVWHHLVGVRDPATLKAYLYVDGALVGSSSGGAAVFGPMSNLDNEVEPVRMGQLFGGAIDEVAIYHGALTAAQVSAIYSAPEGKCP